MKLKRFSEWYAIVIGTCMILMWMFFVMSGNVPEFDVKPWEIIYHLIAEFSTAILLVVAGTLSIKQHTNSRSLLLTAFGMLLYTVIASPGYYAQKGDFTFVVFFSALTILTIISIIVNISYKGYTKNN